MGKEYPSGGVFTADDGCRLEYTVVGSLDGGKPLLLFVVGSSGLGAFYHHLAVQLSEHFTCVHYDRRGFRSPQSTLTGIDDANTIPSTVIPRHAEDAAALIAHLTRPRTHQDARPPRTYVFATSFGATVALCLVLEHPDLIRQAILHEPMLPNMLPEGQERNRSLANFRTVYNARLTFPVFTERFLSVNGDELATDTTISSSTMSTPKENNFWSKGSAGNLEQARSESLAVTYYHPDPSQLAAASGKIVVAAGVDSKNFPIYAMSRALAQAIPALQGEIQNLEGGHFTFVSRKYIGAVSAKIKSIFQTSSSVDDKRRNEKAKM
nr:putative hydrolase [Quercus suber]